MRRTLTTIAALTATLALLAGCGSDDEPEASDEPGTSEVASPDADADPDATDGTATEPTETEPTEEPTTAEPLAEDKVELCAAFSAAYEGLAANPQPEDEDEPLEPALIDVLRQWGEDLSAATLPLDFSPELRAGVDAMIRTLSAVPDDATSADLDRIEDQLSEEQSEQAEAVSDWATENCDLG